MNLLYIGAGFVGACSAAVAADSGHNTLVYDTNADRVQKLSSGDRDTIESCLFERGLGDLLVLHKERVRFTNDYALVAEFLETCDAVFLCVSTPEVGETGESNMTYYRSALESLAKVLKDRNTGVQSKHIVVVNKSTVPIGTADFAKKFLADNGVANVGVASNPEFLVEGKAVSDSLKPDRIVVGAYSSDDLSVLRGVYQRFFQDPTIKYIEVTPPEAEAGKLLANFYLFAKLALCFDVIGRVGESFSNIRFEEVRKILTSDERIGFWGMYDSLYAGGSCLIKDARSLAFQMEGAKADSAMVREVYNANNRQLQNFLRRADACGIDWSTATVAMLGLAFKRDTNDIRNSPSVPIVKFLQEKNVPEIRLYDPAAAAEMKQVFAEGGSILYTSSANQSVLDANVIIITTDWPELRGVADTLLATAPAKKSFILDGRRLLAHKYKELQAAGYTIVAVGSPLFSA